MPMRPLVSIALAAAICGCGQPQAPFVDHAYVRLPAVPGNPGVAYFQLHGGATPATLRRVSSPRIARAELHESMDHGGMTMMAPIAAVAVPARVTVTFKPGGKHVMLHGVGGDVAKGTTIPLIFDFEGQQPITIDVPVIGAGDPPPS